MKISLMVPAVTFTVLCSLEALQAPIDTQITLKSSSDQQKSASSTSLTPEKTQTKPTVAKQAAKTPPKPSQGQFRVTNTIDKDQVGVYKMLSWHYPNKFKVWLNGKEMATGDSITVPSGNLEVIYEYEWSSPWGIKAGKKRALYKTVPDQKDYSIIFKGWEIGPERISITKAQRIAGEDLVD